MESFANFAATRVRTAPVPMAAGTTLVVEDDSVFASLTPPYFVTVWPFAATEPTPDNSETLRVTARSGKTLTFARAAEGSTAMKIWPGMRIAQLPTKLFYESIGEDAVAAAVPAAVEQAVAEAVPEAVAQAETNTNEKIEGLFDDVDPEPLGVAAPGTFFGAAHRDHVHLLPKLDGLNAPGDTTSLDATTLLHGLMSKADKSKLDGISAGADVTRAAIAAAAPKSPPVDADRFAALNSEAGEALVTVSLSALKAVLKTYFDSLYQPKGGSFSPPESLARTLGS